MASTVGHALCGIDCLLLSRMIWPEFAPKIVMGTFFGAAFLANVPDLDLLVGPVLGEHPHYLHGQMTHSLSFAVFVGVFFGLAAKLSKVDAKPSLVWALCGFCGILSHVLIDWFTGPNPGVNPSFGTMILWPFSEERIQASVTVFLGPEHASLDELFSLHNLWVMTRELIVFGGFGVLFFAFSRELRIELKSFWQNMFAKRPA
ncbi:MAG: inner membrane protein [Paraglaciecola sp.]|jgi:inner membrane protein